MEVHLHEKAPTSPRDGEPALKFDVTECAFVLRSQISARGQKPKLVAFLANEDKGALLFARGTANACAKDGVDFELRQVNKLNLREELSLANKDPNVHGIMVYYPVFGTTSSLDKLNMGRMVGAQELCPRCFLPNYCQETSCSHFTPCPTHGDTPAFDDNDLRDCVSPLKDVEGLCHTYRHSLYHNIRYLDEEKSRKCVVPCTPAACMKILETLGVWSCATQGRRLEGKVATVINRSDIVGHPLAFMLANEGAVVYSVDIDSIFVLRGGTVCETKETSASACRQSNIIILGVPSKEYQLPVDCVSENTVLINLSPFKPVDQESLLKIAGVVWVPQVGKVTVAMLQRNLNRLYQE